MKLQDLFEKLSFNAAEKRYYKGDRLLRKRSQQQLANILDYANDLEIEAGMWTRQKMQAAQRLLNREEKDWLTPANLKDYKRIIGYIVSSQGMENSSIEQDINYPNISFKEVYGKPVK